MPLRTAFAVWIALGVTVAFGIWLWAFRRFGAEALVYCSLFVPLGFGIAHGQDIAFVTALLIAAFCAAERGRQVLCGVLLALLLCKFHLFLLMPMVLVVRREWRILAGYVPVALGAVAISAWMASPRAYLDFLNNPKLAALNPSPELMVNVHAIAINFGLDFVLVRILLVLAVGGAALAIPRSAPLDRWFWAAVAGGLLISPHTFAYDVALLLAPILKTVCDSATPQGIRWIGICLLVPFVYFMSALPMPFSAGPAILVTLLYLGLAWPEWFARRRLANAPERAMA